VANMRRLGRRQSLSYLRSRAGLFMGELQHGILQQVHNGYVRHGQRPPGIARDVRYARRWAECNYRRRPYDGSVALFRSTDPAARIYPAPLMGWQQLLKGQVDVYDVPGEHMRMLSEPAIGSVAQVLSTRLQAAAYRCGPTATS